MRNVWTITKREINLYFVSPIAYVVAFAFLLVMGLVFETPRDIMALARLGVVSPHGLAARRKWWVLLAFVIAALVTPWERHIRRCHSRSPSMAHLESTELLVCRRPADRRR